MQVRRVTSADLASINTWLRAQKHPEATADMLPSLGFIVPGVAAGFIRDCETGVGMVDSYVSNPFCSSATRHRGLEDLTSTILAQPFKQFITMTADRGLAHRFQTHGLILMPNYAWLVKGDS